MKSKTTRIGWFLMNKQLSIFLLTYLAVLEVADRPQSRPFGGSAFSYHECNAVHFRGWVCCRKRRPVRILCPQEPDPAIRVVDCINMTIHSRTVICVYKRIPIGNLVSVGI